MSWRNKLSWRWIIRCTCLGLLGLCVGLWGLSSAYRAVVSHNASSVVGLQLNSGKLTGFYYRDIAGSAFFPAAGWSLQWGAKSPGRPFMLNRIGGDFPGFGVARVTGRVSGSAVDVPLWFLTVLLAVISWIAWRKTGRGETARGFPIEPLASRRENAGG